MHCEPYITQDKLCFMLSNIKQAKIERENNVYETIHLIINNITVFKQPLFFCFSHKTSE